MSFDISIVYHALESVVTFAIIGCVGYALAKKGWFNKDANYLIARLITIVALPPYLLYNINTFISREELLHLAYGLLVPLTSIVITLALGAASARLLGVAPGRRGVFTVSFGLSNTIYIGLPVNLALFGEKALPYVLIYYFANTVFFWTLGNYLIASDGETKKLKIFSMGTVKKIVSPPMYGLLLGLTLLLLNIKLPTVLANTAKYLGNLTTPLVVISIGVTLFEMGFSKIKFSKDLLAVICARVIISPLVVIALIWLFPLPELMRKVFVIQSSLPAMTSIAMLANFYKADVDYATVIVSVTTLLAIVSIPAFMVLVTYLY